MTFDHHCPFNVISIAVLWLRWDCADIEMQDIVHVSGECIWHACVEALT